MGRLVFVSNRVERVIKNQPTSGGLVAAVSQTLQRTGGLWFGWNGEIVEPRDIPETVSNWNAPSTRSVVEADSRINYATLPLSRSEYDLYYCGFANRALWPLLHSRLDLFAYDREERSSYDQVNAKFAGKLAELLRPDDMLWVHDYHLISLARTLRKLGVVQPIGFFLHTPFPPKRILSALPGHADLMRGLLDYDVVGFQTADDVDAFRDYAQHHLGAEFASANLVRTKARDTVVGAFPIGLDVAQFEMLAQSRDAAAAAQRLRDSIGAVDLIFGVDRLDYTKGLLHRFRIYERFLERFPERQGRVALLQIAAPTRETIPEYERLKRQTAALSGDINGRFGRPSWTPIRYVNRAYARRTLAGYHRLARIGLVTPLMDGMNLVAKEYVAAQDPHDPGVLVLSRFAGAAAEVPTALIVNPHDFDDVAEAIERGLLMPLAERQERWGEAMAHLRLNDVAAWTGRFRRALPVTTAVPMGSVA
jgi:trehalose 6-phosphate synthase